MGLTPKVVTRGGWKGCRWPGGRAGPQRIVVIGAATARQRSMFTGIPSACGEDVAIARQRSNFRAAGQSEMVCHQMSPRNQSVGRLNCGWSAAGPLNRPRRRTLALITFTRDRQDYGTQSASRQRPVSPVKSDCGRFSAREIGFGGLGHQRIGPKRPQPHKGFVSG
jgi:hypothetical protein